MEGSGETVTISIGLFVAIVVAALIIGSCFGVFILALCQISARSDERSEKMRSEFSGKDER